jgi:hypothetical protein
MELQAPDEESMIRVAVADLDDRFASIDRSRIEGTVRRLVHEWFTRAHVKLFVGIIAERHARTELQQVGPEARRAVDATA